MARLPLVRRRLSSSLRIVTIITHWLNILYLLLQFLQNLVILFSRLNSPSLRRRYIVDFYSRREHMHELVYRSDQTCIEQLRMNIHAFKTLCSMLQNVGKLKDTKHMMVDEQVALFSHILAHHVKNIVIKFRFNRSGGTISRHFHNVLNNVIRLHKELIKKLQPLPEGSTDEKWKWFKNCIGAIDGTYVKAMVPLEDKPRYRNRKGEIATNVLAACSQDGQFTYVLAGWEGSAADGRVLREALCRPNGLKVPVGQNYLADAGYTNGVGFLTPYRGQRYHLNDWRDGHQPTNAAEYFNMRHSSARNVIERCFGMIKMRWAILRSHSFYPMKIQNRIILACCLLHNFLKKEMPIDELDESFNLGQNLGNVDDPTFVSEVETSNEWTSFRDNLASTMFNEWRNRH